MSKRRPCGECKYFEKAFDICDKELVDEIGYWHGFALSVLGSCLIKSQLTTKKD